VSRPHDYESKPIATVRLYITREDRSADRAKVNCVGFLARTSRNKAKQISRSLIRDGFSDETDDSDKNKIHTRKGSGDSFLRRFLPRTRIGAYFGEIFTRDGKKASHKRRPVRV